MEIKTYLSKEDVEKLKDSQKIPEIEKEFEQINNKVAELLKKNSQNIYDIKVLLNESQLKALHENGIELKDLYINDEEVGDLWAQIFDSNISIEMTEEISDIISDNNPFK